MNKSLKKQSGFTPTPNLTLLQRCGRVFSHFKNTGSFSSDDRQFSESAKRRENWCRGFTLIEMIVSLGLFSIVVTVAVGALLMLVATNQQLQGEQSVMTNLSFALDSMTREIRTGTRYNCEWSTNNSNNVFDPNSDVDEEHGDETNDCPNGNPSPGNNHFIGMSFKEGGDSITDSSDRILYYFDKTQGKIFRKTDNDAPQSITSSGIFIKSFDIFVSGSSPLSSASSQRDQASVTIFIEAAETSDPNKKPYYLQTTISQRTLDL